MLRKSVSIIGSFAMVASLGLASATTTHATETPTPRLAPMASPPITGTPAEILQEVPVTEPLTVGYKAGLFLPVGAMTKKDKRGCTLRNQLLIQMATKKPKVGNKCKLSGGEWLVDFGTKKLTKPSQVKLGTLLPDKYVYAQGAYGWNETQRKAYAENYAPSKSLAGRNRAARSGLLVNSTQQPFSKGGISKLSLIQNVLAGPAVEQRGGDTRDEQVAAELNRLREQNPEFFDSWTVTTLLNAKAWGLSFTPGTNANFQVTIEKCSLEEAPKGEQNPCTTTYSVPNEAATYNISVVPQTASLVPPTVTSTPGSTAVPTISYQAPVSGPIERSLFGIHAPADWVSDLASGFDGPIKEATIPNVPVGYLRLWDTETTWADIEPAEGQFVWRKLDKQIEMGQILQARVMLVLGRTPSWAGDSPTSMPRSIDSWRNYVKEVSCRYRGSIASYEVWNEANLDTFWTGTPEQMADLTAVAFEEIRKCDPGALVVAANTTSRATGSFGTFYPAYLEALKARNWPVDAYSVHSYPTASGGANDRIRGIGQFRTMLAAAGAEQTTVFDTEINYGLAGLGEGKVDLTGANAMALLSRTYIDSVRYGFGSTFWFVWTANPDSKFGIQFTRAASAEQAAWRGTYDWLVGAQFQRCVETNDKLVICQFNRGPSNFSIVWRGDVGDAPGQVSSSIVGQLGSRTCDLFGNCNAFGVGDSVAVGPVPTRIDGAPLDLSQTPESGQGTSTSPEVTELPLPPQLAPEPQIQYLLQNNVQAEVAWTESATPSTVPVTGFQYQLLFCGKSTKNCGDEDVARRGSTNASPQQLTLRLSEGPGKYLLRVRSVNTAGASEWSTQELVVESTRALPPSDVVANFNTDTRDVVLTWTAPNVVKSKIDSYEIQMTALDPRIPWNRVTFETKGTSLTKSLSELKLGPTSTFQFRVRTKLKTGATSIFEVSNELTFASNLPAPFSTAITSPEKDDSNNLTFTTAVFLSEVTKTSWQLRYSLDQGATWEPFPDSFYASQTSRWAPAIPGALSSKTGLAEIDWESLGVRPDANLRVQVRYANAELQAASPWKAPTTELRYLTERPVRGYFFAADSPPRNVTRIDFSDGVISNYLGYN